MSKGSDRITIRVPAEILAEMDDYIAASVHTRHDEPYTRSSWLLAAIKEKLRHRKASNPGRSKSKQSKAE